MTVAKGKQDITTMPSYQAAMPPAGSVQCAGCPAGEPYVMPARPGHLSDCEECTRHCQCFRSRGYGS